MNSTKNKIYVTSEYVDIGTIFDDEMHDIAAYRDRIVSELNRIQERVQSESLYVDLEVQNTKSILSTKTNSRNFFALWKK